MYTEQRNSTRELENTQRKTSRPPSQHGVEDPPPRLADIIGSPQNRLGERVVVTSEVMMSKGDDQGGSNNVGMPMDEGGGGRAWIG